MVSAVTILRLIRWEYGRLGFKEITRVTVTK